MKQQAPSASAPACPAARIIGGCDIPLWGLDGTQRLARQLPAVGIRQVLGSGEPLPQDGSVLLVRGDYLFEERTLRDLACTPGTLLVTLADDARPRYVAAHVTAADAVAAAAVVGDGVSPQRIPGVRVTTPATLSSAYEGKLLKTAPPVVLPIRASNRDALERHLFGGAYKGVTDLVTKWVWPRPARWATAQCVRLGIGPNAVTMASLVLALLTIVCFARASFVLGLVLAWVMTFLDTVDGKLARVTITSTPAGHIFDHAIDLITPPLWYIAWGYGVAVAAGTGLTAPLVVTLALIVAGYIAGRLVEATFDFRLKAGSMFCWRPFDSYFRLITARRNPNLLLLSAAALLGAPAQGLLAVAVWTAVSTVVLAVRLIQALAMRARHVPLRSWLEELGPAPASVPAYARPFLSPGPPMAQVSQ